MTNFQIRFVTAAFFIIVMMAGMFWNETSFKTLFFLIGLGCWWEYLNLTLVNDRWRHVFGVFLYSVIYWSWQHLAFNNPRISILILTLFISVYLIVEMFLASEKTFRNVAYLTLGILYITFPITFLQDLSYMNSKHVFSPNLVASLVYLTWLNDTMAYIVGSRYGKNLIIPLISPKKTWEGNIAGLCACLSLTLLLTNVMGVLPWYHWLAICIIVPVFGSLGDLVESLLKRSVNAKDSSNLFPGHGGFFDRYDAFIMQIPFVYLYLVVFELN